MIAEQEAPLTRRAKRRADRRQSIVDAAMRIVVEDGVDALTMPRLARKLDVAVGGLYRYFDSKDRLLATMELVAVDAFGVCLKGRIDDSASPIDPATALARLWAVADAWMGFADQEPVLFRLLEALSADARTLLDDEAMRELQQQHIDPVLGLVAQAVQGAVELGALDPGDPAERVHVMWGVLSGIAMFRKQDHRRAPELSASRLAVRAMTAIFVGWGADHDVVVSARDLA